MRSVVRACARVPGIRLGVAGLAVTAAVGIGGCGRDGDAGRSAPRPTTSLQAPAPADAQQDAAEAKAEAATTAMRRHGWRIAGPIGPPAAFRDAECTPTADRTGDLDCEFGVAYFGNMEPTSFVVRIGSDGTLRKVLGDREPVAGMPTSAQTAALLASDDRLQDAPSRAGAYACHRARRVEPDGRSGATDASGQLCSATLRVRRLAVLRYVEFAADGTATRDYVVHP